MDHFNRLVGRAYGRLFAVDGLRLLGGASHKK